MILDLIVVYRLLAGRFGVRSPVGDDILRLLPDRPRGLPSILCNGYPVFLRE